MTLDNLPDNPLDQATSHRLAKLRSMPVDTSNLIAAIHRHIPQSQSSRRMWIGPVRLLASIAAIIAIVVGVWVFTSAPVMASPADIAQWHRDMISGKNTMLVTGTDPANKILAGQHCPMLPAIPGQPVQACCTQSLDGCAISCGMVTCDNVPVTIAVGDSSKIRLASSSTITVDGRTFHTNHDGDITIVTQQQGGRWVCAVGSLPAEKLAGLIKDVK